MFTSDSSIGCLIGNLKKGAALKLKRALREDGEQAKFAENLRASPFNKDISNKTTFSLIHLDGQYL
jgi:hypothetical protein